jgi:zinc protease
MTPQVITGRRSRAARPAPRVVASLLLAWLVALVAPAAPVGAQAVPTRPAAPQVAEFTAGGVRVLHKPVTANDVIAVRLYLRGGAAALTPRTAGIEQLLLETATRGTAKYDKDAFSARATATGTEIGGDAARDYSVATLQAVRQHWDEAWDLFTQAVLHPTFPAAEVEQARARQAFALRQRRDDPDSYLELVNDSVFYAGHPYAADPRGTPAAVAALTRDDLVAWHRRRMTKANLLLVVVGNVPRQDLERRVAAAFGALPASGGAAARVPAVAAGRPGVTVLERALPTNYISGLYVAAPRASGDYPALQLATRVLGERLFEEVRTKRNLTYAVSARHTAGVVGRADLYVTAVEPETTLKVMREEVRRLQREPVPEDRLQETRNVFATAYWMGQETNMGQAQQLGLWEIAGGGWRNALTFTDRLRTVSSGDVQRVARRYLTNARFVVVGDPKKIDRALFSSM